MPQVVLTTGVASDDDVRKKMANLPDGTSIRFCKGEHGTFQATKSGGSVTIAAVGPGNASGARVEVTDDAVIALANLLGEWNDLPLSSPGPLTPYRVEVISKERVLEVPMGSTIEVLSERRGTNGYFDMEARPLLKKPTKCVNFESPNCGGAERSELEHSGDVPVRKNNKNFLKQALSGVGHEDAAMLFTGYLGMSCRLFGLATVCIIDHKNRVVYLDPLYNGSEIGEATFQVAAVILANREGSDTYTYVSISSTDGVTAFNSDETIPDLTYKTEAVRAAFEQIKRAKERIRHQEETRRSQLAGTSVSFTAAPPMPLPQSNISASSLGETGVLPCLYIVASSHAAALVPPGNPCVYITDNKGLSTSADDVSTGPMTSPLYLWQALEDTNEICTESPHAAIVVSSQAHIPKAAKKIVTLDEFSIRDSLRHYIGGYFNGVLFLLYSPKSADSRGAALVEKLQPNILAGFGYNNWLVVQGKNADGQTEWYHCAGSMGGKYAAGDAVTATVNKFLANPDRLPVHSVSKGLMVQHSVYPHYIPYENFPGTLKQRLDVEDAFEYHEKKVTEWWLHHCATAFRVLSDAAIVELMAECNRVEEELIAEKSASLKSPPAQLGLQDVGTEAFTKMTAERKKRRSQLESYKCRLTDLLTKNLYDPLRTLPGVGTGRLIGSLAGGRKFVERANKVQGLKQTFEEMRKDNGKMIEMLESRELTTAVLAINRDAYVNSSRAVREGKPYQSPFSERSAAGRECEMNLDTVTTTALLELAATYPNGHPTALLKGGITLGGPDQVDGSGQRGFFYLPLFLSLLENISKEAPDGTIVPLDYSAANRSLDEDVGIMVQMLATMITEPTISTRGLPPLARNSPKVLQWVSSLLLDVMLRLARRASSNGPTEGEHQTMCKSLAVLLLNVWGTGTDKVVSGFCFFSSSQRPKSYHFVPSQWSEFAQFLYCVLKLTDWTHLYERAAEWLRVYFNRNFFQKKVAAIFRVAAEKKRKELLLKQGNKKDMLESAEYHRNLAACFQQIKEGKECTGLQWVRFLGGTESDHRYDCFEKLRDRKRNPFLLLSGVRELSSLHTEGMQGCFPDKERDEWTWKTVLHFVLLGKMVKDIKRLWNCLPKDQPGPDLNTKKCSTLWGYAPEFLYHCLGASLIKRKLQSDIRAPDDLLEFSKVTPQPTVKMVNTPAVHNLVKFVRKKYGDRKEACFQLVYFWPGWNKQSAANRGGTASSSAAAASETDTSASSTDTPAMEEVATYAQRCAAVVKTVGPMLDANDRADVLEILNAGPRTPQLIAYALGMKVNQWHGFNALFGWTTQTWADGLLVALEDPLGPIERILAEAMPARPLTHQALTQAKEGLLQSK